jgi:hypothetical protein
MLIWPRWNPNCHHLQGHKKVSEMPCLQGNIAEKGLCLALNKRGEVKTEIF